MPDPFLGEIRVFSFDRVPHGWAQCNGQLLQINQNQALYALLGTVYGGNGTTTFGLPNLQGRVPIQIGNGIMPGQMSGEESHVLTTNEIPPHTHQITAGSNATATNPAGNVWGTSSTSAYSETINSQMSSSALATAGSGEAHPNMQPYLVLNYCIATQGNWPPRN